MHNPARSLKKADRAMRSLALGLVVTIIAFTGDVPVAVAQTAPTPLHGEFAIGKSGRFILLPVQIVDRDILCLLDTGASLSAFDLKLRALLGKPQPKRLIDTPGARTRVETFDWPQVTLGLQTLRSSKPVAGIDLESLRQATNQQVYGVIGMDVLSSSRLHIDFDRGTLKFLDQLPQPRDALGERIPIQFASNGTPRLAAAIGEGAPEEHFLIDTGAQGSSLAHDVFDELVDQSHVHLGSTFASVTIAGSTRGERGRLDSIAIGPFTKANLRFSRVRMSSLGLRYFSRFRVTFDFPGECLYLRQGTHYDKPEPQATSGLILKWIDGEVRVDALRDGGPAATVGVQSGDVLLQIDEKLARDYDPFALRELLTSRGGRTVALAVRRGERQINFELVLDAD